jgi:hypothetical protein
MLGPGSIDPCEAEEMTRCCATERSGSRVFPNVRWCHVQAARATPQTAIAVIHLVIRRCTATRLGSSKFATRQSWYRLKPGRSELFTTPYDYHRLALRRLGSVQDVVGRIEG